MSEAEVGEQHGVIDVPGDLLRSTLSGHVLGACQRRASSVTGKAQQVLGDQRHGSTRALLPRRISGRIDDHLAYDPPAGVVRVTASDQEPCQCLGHGHSARFRPMVIEVPQSGAHVAAIVDRSGQRKRRPPRLACLLVDASTVLRRQPAAGLDSSAPAVTSAKPQRARSGQDHLKRARWGDDVRYSLGSYLNEIPRRTR